jgi:hypothetical protein
MIFISSPALQGMELKTVSQSGPDGNPVVRIAPIVSTEAAPAAKVRGLCCIWLA